MDKNNQVFFKEQGRLSLQEIIEKAQNYSDAHQFHEVQFEKKNTNEKGRYQKQFHSKDSAPAFENSNTKVDKSREHTGSFQQKKEIKCYQCGKVGHKSYQCEKKQNGSQNNQSKFNHQASQHKSGVCQIEQRRLNGKDLADDVFPVIAPTTEIESEEYLNDLKFPYRGKARVNGKSVNYMRDTDTSLTLIQESYVRPEDYTGKKVSVLLADRCVRFYPEVSIDISSPCYSGTIKALALKNPVHTLVIGNNIFQNDFTPTHRTWWKCSTSNYL